MATERKKKTDDFDIFATSATDSKRRRIAAPVTRTRAGGPSGPAIAGGPSGPAIAGGPSGPAIAGKGAPVVAKRRRRSADDKDLKALYDN